MKNRQSDDPTRSKLKDVKKSTLMNEELKEWLQETRQDSTFHKSVKKTSKNDRKAVGRCYVCGEKEAKEVCIRCGKSVCTACYFHLVGLCKKCLSKTTGEKWKGIKPDWEKTLGVEWID